MKPGYGARYLADRGDLEGAEKHLREATHLLPEDTTLKDALGTLLLRKHDAKGALEQYPATLFEVVGSM